MKRAVVLGVATLSLCMFTGSGFCDVKKGEKVDGQKEFQKHCASCHPNGGNIMNAQKTLSKKSLAAHGIKSSKDIIAKMRNPGPGMPKFDEKTLPQNEAKAIADYMQKTFK